MGDGGKQKKISKFMSLVLRHEPALIGIDALEPGGFVPVETLLGGMRGKGISITRDELEEVVKSNEKQRFSFDHTGTKIRCNQGHSVPVDLELTPATPPDFLFHGTPAANLDAIREGGLRRMQRHAVHLSPDAETATIVGRRRGKPVALKIEAGRMHREGHTFYRSTNGVGSST